MSLGDRTAKRVTVGVFEQARLHEAETLAHDLGLRKHHVAIQSREQLRRRESLRSRTSTVGGLLLGAAALGAAGATVLLAALVFDLFPHPSHAGLQLFVAVAATGAALGGVAAWRKRGRSASTQLADAMEALAEPGRFALAVETTASRGPFVEARLTQCGAIALGSF